MKEFVHEMDVSFFISLKIDLKSKGAFDINVSGGWNKLKYASQI